MEIKIGLCKEYREAEAERRRQRFVADGTAIEHVPYTVTVEVPVAELTPASRQALLLASYGGELSVPRGEMNPTLYEADAIPATPAEWDAMLADYAAAYAAGQTLHEEWCREQDRRRAEQRAADARNYEANDRARAQEAAQKAAQRAAKSEWIAEHGSEHLRQATAADYDCQRLYVTERLAAEHPGYEVDWHDNAEWRSRSCPSPEALAEALRVEGEVVWLTNPPRPRDADEEELGEEYEAREAVVINQWLNQYDLIRVQF